MIAKQILSLLIVFIIILCFYLLSKLKTPAKTLKKAQKNLKMEIKIPTPEPIEFFTDPTTPLFTNPTTPLFTDDPTEFVIKFFYPIIDLQKHNTFQIIHLRSFIQPNNDNQSAHDTSVNHNSRIILKELFKNINLENSYISINEARQFSESDKLQLVLNEIEKNQFIATYENNEMHLFHAIWQRTENDIDKKQLVIKQLLDCWEDNELVCINGRVNRFILSLQGVDSLFDKIQNTDMIRTEIFSRCGSVILQNTENPPINFIESAEKYKNNLGIDNEFREYLISEITKIINEYTNLPSRILDKTLSEAISAI